MNEKIFCDISFARKVEIFSRDYLKCCSYIARIDEPRLCFSKMLFSKLVSTSQLLEDFLDFHGAKNNKNWFFYRELSAAVRHLSIAAYSQKHICNRLVFYDLGDMGSFVDEGQAAVDFLIDCFMNLAPVILEEARRLSIPVPEESFNPEDFPGITTTEFLDYDIDDENRSRQKKHIVAISNEFLKIASEFDALEFFEPHSLENIKDMVPDKVNEVEIRRREMTVHNLQSSFDTYVIHGGYRFGNRKLKQLRSHFSIVLHLLQMMGRLLHLYERHVYEAGYKDSYRAVRERLARLINADLLLDRTINYGLYYVNHFMSGGKELAREIMNENIERDAVKVGIPVSLGFHCRPSLLVAKIVQHYGGEVELCIGRDRFDASSVLDIQWAGGKIQKENIKEVVFEGDVRALKDIKVLAGLNYCEDTMGKGLPLPKELHYLK